MAHAIRIEGRAKVLVVGLVFVLLIGPWLAPGLLSRVIGSGGRGFSYLRGGYVEQHKTNLTGHWLTAAKGSYTTGFILAFEGETIVVDQRIEIREGRFALGLRRYDWSTLPHTVWSEWISKSREGALTVEIPATGLYDLRISYLAFAGSLVLDWGVD